MSVFWIAKIGRDFEAELIRILGIDDRRAQVEATIALARIGTIACVEPLLSLAKRSDTPDEIRSPARRTVTRIQNAVRGEGGRLSVVQEEGEGKLSVAGASGELSVKDDGSGES